MAVPEGAATGPRRQVAGVIFEEGDRSRLLVGNLPLREYLVRARLKWVLAMAKLMDELDWSAFEKAYAPGGRPPLHPKLVVGLMMYAALQKQDSLRQMEELARRDLGAWWVAAGVTPDHTTVARFVVRHEALLTVDFFEQLTSNIARRMGATASDFAIDGTVKRAAASAACTLRREALEQKLAQTKDEADTAKSAAQAAPGDEKAQELLDVAKEEVDQLETAHQVLVEREEASKAAGKRAGVQVSPVEPDAVVQPLKRSNDYGPAYKPVVGAHPAGIIISQGISPSSETEPVRELVEQHQRVLGQAPKRVLADSGFASLPLLALFVGLGIDVLIPTGRGGKPRKGPKGRFPKSAFRYDAEMDRVHCPTGAEMKPGRAFKDRHDNTYREFRTPACKTCPLRDKCTSGTQRAYKRYDGDELKEHLADILSHPEARRAYAQRSAIVEPVFARFLANGFARFRRRGLRRVRTEFALRCSAHNIGLFMGRWRAVFVVFAVVRRPGAPWSLFIFAAATTF